MTRTLTHGLFLLLLLAGLSAPVAAQTQPGGSGDFSLSDNSQRESAGLLSLFQGDGDDLLPPEQAFPFAAELVGEDIIIARWDTAEGYYLYRDRIDFQVQGAKIAGYTLPDGKNKDDPNFGLMEVYYGPLEIYIRLTEPATNDLVLTASYQGCADSGVCYPPMSTDFDMAAGTQSAGFNSGGPDTRLPAQPGNQLGSLLSGGSLPLILGGFFSAGLLLAFTACLYPLIPILSGIIAGDAHRSSRRAFLLSLVFVQATALTYALAGAAAGLSGSAIQADLQSPLLLGAFAALFVALAMAMFGIFSLQMPAAVQTRLDALARRQRGGTFIGAGIMGALSALIVGACSGPALIAALVFISNTGDAWLGGLALFAMGNGLGFPLLLLGTAAGRWLPGAGPWMVAVRRVFGIVFLGVAIWMLDRFLPDPLILGLWALLLIGIAIWLGSSLRGAAPGAVPKFRLFVSVLFVIWGSVLMVGAASGGRSFWQPLQPLVQSGEQQSPAIAWQSVRTVEELQAALRQAGTDGRSVLLDVYADWCIYCVQLESNTFPDPRVRRATADSVMLKMDVTRMSSADKALLSHLDVFLPPAVIFFGPDGRERPDYRVVGFMPPEDFSRVAGQALETR